MTEEIVGKCVCGNNMSYQDELSKWYCSRCNRTYDGDQPYVSSEVARIVNDFYGRRREWK